MPEGPPPLPSFPPPLPPESGPRPELSPGEAHRGWIKFGFDQLRGLAKVTGGTTLIALGFVASIEPVNVILGTNTFLIEKGGDLLWNGVRNILGKEDLPPLPPEDKEDE